LRVQPGFQIVEDRFGASLPEPEPCVGCWHTVAVRCPPWLGLPTAALPTFGAECRVTVAFQTFHWHAAKVGS
jgi:hypothetical protein